ncbi:hypothetical protein [Clostridium sp. Cult2]|uniref:hypothetical protein n=1 Tax=Clostridium sp. Cult2 TaxID=2079003 RepID=UPI001F484C81|nr:hypothetical protein [Clostridium sp. Cult2]
MSKTCINCEDRHLGCHSKCKKYQEFKKEREKFRKKKYSNNFEYKDYIANRLWESRKA